MIVYTTKTPRKRSCGVACDGDTTTAALLYWLYKTGQLSRYPLPRKRWPDNDRTAATLGSEILKLKLRSDLRRGGSWTARIAIKTMPESMSD